MNLKKLLAVLLCIAMCVSMLPAFAFAEAEPEEPAATEAAAPAEEPVPAEESETGEESIPETEAPTLDVSMDTADGIVSLQVSTTELDITGQEDTLKGETFTLDFILTVAEPDLVSDVTLFFNSELHGTHAFHVQPERSGDKFCDTVTFDEYMPSDVYTLDCIDVRYADSTTRTFYGSAHADYATQPAALKLAPRIADIRITITNNGAVDTDAPVLTSVTTSKDANGNMRALNGTIRVEAYDELSGVGTIELTINGVSYQLEEGQDTLQLRNYPELSNGTFRIQYIWVEDAAGNARYYVTPAAYDTEYYDEEVRLGGTAEDYTFTVTDSLSDAPALKLDTTTAISTTGEFAYFSFIPKHSSLYRFEATDGAVDSVGTIYRGSPDNYTGIFSNDDGGEGNAFRIDAELEAGQVYYLGVRYYSSSESGDIDVRLTDLTPVKMPNISYSTDVLELFDETGDIEYGELEITLDFGSDSAIADGVIVYYTDNNGRLLLGYPNRYDDFTMKVRMSEYKPDGTYQLSKIELRDRGGKSVTYYGPADDGYATAESCHQLTAEQCAAFTVTHRSGKADTTPPVVSGISVTNLGSGQVVTGSSVYFSLDVSDDVSGFQDGTIGLRKMDYPGITQIDFTGSFAAWTPCDGEAGTYLISYVTVYDRAGNQKTYYTPASDDYSTADASQKLDGRVAEYSFVVSQVSPAPQVTNVTLSTDTLDVDEGLKLAVTAELNVSTSVVKWASVSFIDDRDNIIEVSMEPGFIQSFRGIFSFTEFSRNATYRIYRLKITTTNYTVVTFSGSADTSGSYISLPDSCKDLSFSVVNSSTPDAEPPILTGFTVDNVQPGNIIPATQFAAHVTVEDVSGLDCGYIYLRCVDTDLLVSVRIECDGTTAPVVLNGGCGYVIESIELTDCEGQTASYYTPAHEEYKSADAEYQLGGEVLDYYYTTETVSDETIRWTFRDGTLTIYGDGAMPDYHYTMPPWSGYGDQITRIVVMKGITTIGNFAFANLKQVSSVSLPYGLLSIGKSAFRGCDALGTTSPFSIPVTVQSIGEYAFYKSGLRNSLSIPASVTALGRYAFAYTQLPYVTMADSGVTELAYGAFRGCEALTEIALPDSLAAISIRTFEDTALEGIDLCDSVKSIGEGAFLNCKSLASCTGTGNVKAIADNAFSGCSALSETDDFSQLQTIGERAFSDCSALSSVSLGGVTTLAYAAFDRCSSLTQLNLGGCLKSIGAFALADCSSLETVNLPVSFASCGDYALRNTNAGCVFYYAGRRTQWDSNVNTSAAFNNYTVICLGDTVQIPLAFDTTGVSMDGHNVTDTAIKSWLQSITANPNSYGSLYYYPGDSVSQAEIDKFAAATATAKVVDITTGNGAIQTMSFRVTLTDASGNQVRAETAAGSFTICLPMYNYNGYMAGIQHGNDMATVIACYGGPSLNVSSLGDFRIFYAESAPQARIGSTYYDTLTEALAAAERGDTVELLCEIGGFDTPYVTVNAGVTLDLCGHSMTALQLLYVTGSLVDSGSPKGAFHARAYYLNHGENTQFPVFDSVTGTYSLYEMGFYASATKAPKYRFGLNKVSGSTDAAAAAARMQSDANQGRVVAMVTVSWTQGEGSTAVDVSKTFTFTKDYMSAYLVSPFTKSLAITLSGMSSVGSVKAQPMFVVLDNNGSIMYTFAGPEWIVQ